jgi:hypothetical protein
MAMTRAGGHLMHWIDAAMTFVALAATIRDDIAKWTEVVRISGAKVD